MLITALAQTVCPWLPSDSRCRQRLGLPEDREDEPSRGCRGCTAREDNQCTWVTGKDTESFQRVERDRLKVHRSQCTASLLWGSQQSFGCCGTWILSQAILTVPTPRAAMTSMSSKRALSRACPQQGKGFGPERLHLPKYSDAVEQAEDPWQGKQCIHLCVCWSSPPPEGLTLTLPQCQY